MRDDADADLVLVLARTGHRRLLWLASESNPDPAKREGARAAVAELAAKFRGEAPPAAAGAPPPPARIPARLALRAARLGGRNCPYADAPSCGCDGVHCHRLGRVAGLDDCAACLGLWTPPGDAP